MNYKTLYISLGILVVLAIGIGLYKTTTVNSPSQTNSVSGPSPSRSLTSAPSTSPSVSAGNTVQIDNTGFQPSTITINTGGKVTWVNNSGAGVSINSAFHPTHLVYPPFNLGVVANGESVFLVFNKTGSYQYHNHFISSQNGTIIVQ